MKTPPQNNPESALDSALREWKVHEPLPPRFSERVWRRLDREQAQVAFPAWSRFSTWLAGVMSRPALALGCVAVFLVLGLSAGYWRAQEQNARASQELGARYVRMMDPYQHPGR